MTLKRAKKERDRYKSLLDDSKNQLKAIAIIPSEPIWDKEYRDSYKKMGLEETEKILHKKSKKFILYVIKDDNLFLPLDTFLFALGLQYGK